jgi:hypothetical protein
MKKLLTHSIVILVLTIACTSLRSQDKSIPKIDTSSGYVIWYDGQEKRTAHILSGLVAEFTSSNSLIKSFDKSATTIVSGSNLKIHRITDSSIKSSLGKGVLPIGMERTGQFSHVFSESGQEVGMMVPANLILVFDKTYTESLVKNFLNDFSLKQLGTLKLVSGNHYIIESTPGLSTLELANYLRLQPGVISASPDWMKHAVRK